jgi:hypothetical protein
LELGDWWVEGEEKGWAYGERKAVVDRIQNSKVQPPSGRRWADMLGLRPRWHPSVFAFVLGVGVGDRI